MNHERFVLLTTDKGSGKTFVSIRSAYLMDKHTQIIVFAPLAKLSDNSWQISTDAFNKAMNTDLKVVGFTYASLISKKKQPQIKTVIQESVRQKRPILILFDEVHELKASSSGTLSKRTRMAIKLTQQPEVTHVLGLSATAMPNSYLDAMSYFIMAGFYPNKTTFIKEQIRVFNDYHAPVVRNPYTGKLDRHYFKDPDKLDDLIERISVYTDTSKLLPTVNEHVKNDGFLHFELDDTLEYIDPVFEEEFNDTQKRTRHGHYRQVLKYKRLGYFESASTALGHLRRITTADPTRLKLVGRIVYNVQHGKEPHPILIFYQNNLELNLLTDFFKTQSVFKGTTVLEVNGKHKDVGHITNPNTVVCIQYKAGSAAIESPEAYTSIFFMPTYTYQNYEQAKGRNVRAGYTHPVWQYKLCADKTIDEDVWDILANKRDFSRKMINTYFTI